jgi:hypothetical protein
MWASGNFQSFAKPAAAASPRGAGREGRRVQGWTEEEEEERIQADRRERAQMRSERARKLQRERGAAADSTKEEVAQRILKLARLRREGREGKGRGADRGVNDKYR